MFEFEFHNYQYIVNTITEGDSLALVRTLPDASVGLVLTDPPYEIEDMVPWFAEADKETH